MWPIRPMRICSTYGAPHRELDLAAAAKQAKNSPVFDTPPKAMRRLNEEMITAGG